MSNEPNGKGAKKMSYFKSIGILIFLVSVLYACNNDNNNKDELVTGTDQANQTTEANQANQNDNGQTEQTVTDDQNEGDEPVDTPYNFTHFDLDVEYENDISYEVEFANDQKGVTAEIDDEINKVETRGDDANNKLVKYFELLTFDANSEDNDVLSQVITAFNLDEDFKSFELEVEYKNGEVKTYKFNK